MFIAQFREPRFDASSPVLEVIVHKGARSCVAVADLEGHIAHRTAHAAVLSLHAVTISLKQGKHAIDGIRHGRFYRIHDGRTEVIEREPENAAALVALANAYWLTGRGPDVVGGLASRALAADPTNRAA